MCVIHYFFFQAEDGIRDAQESRGLGDVYKRQKYKDYGVYVDLRHWQLQPTHLVFDEVTRKAGPIAVSYTHLTLPTIYSV